jgi:hypothetical protein
VGLVAIAGVALAHRGGGDQPHPSPTARRSESTTRTTDPAGVTDDLGAATSLDPIFGTDVEDGGGAVAVGGGSTRTTAKGAKTTKTTTKGGVTHTETRSESHTAPNITSSPPGGDKTSVGHSTNTSISTNTTIKTSTTTSTAPPATDGGDPGGGDDGGTTTPTGTDGGTGP